MPIELKDEYAALRAEMLHRFVKVFDVQKYGIGGVLALMAYIQVTTAQITAAVWLSMLEVMILLMGLVALNEFQIIYRVGTYIALLIEEGSPTKWHRMSRKYPSFVRKQAATSRVSRHHLLYPAGIRWGSDSTQFALALLVLTVLSVGACWVKAGSLVALIRLGSVLVLILVGWVIYALSWGMREFRRKTEDEWARYRKAWGTAAFPDPYASTPAV